MTQEDKELLLQDLCSRLPYGVKCIVTKSRTEEGQKGDIGKIVCVCLEGVDCIGDEPFFSEFGNFKPYLFPMSSMTEEQYNSLYESGILNNCSHSYEYVNPHIHGVSFIFKEFKTYSLELIEWLNKNHFDYRGLIEKGLAIDCTNLNIY